MTGSRTAPPDRMRRSTPVRVAERARASASVMPGVVMPGVVMPGVVACVRERLLRERLRGAFEGRAHIDFVDEPARVLDALHERTALTIVEIPRDDWQWAVELVAQVRAAKRTLTIVAYAMPAAGVGAALLALARAGASDVVLDGIDDSRARLAALLDETASDALADDVLGRLAERALPAGTRHILRSILAWAVQLHAVGDVARVVALPRRTLSQRLHDAGLPPAQTLLGWARLLVAARVLDQTSASVERAALAAGYSSANAFRNALRHHAGVSPHELRARGGYAHLRDALVKLLA